MACDRHLIDGIGLDTYADEFEWDNVLSVPELSGSDLSLPYGAGEIPGNRTIKGRDYTIGLRIVGTDRPDYLERAEALLALVFNDGDTFTLSREFILPAGTRTDAALARFASTSGFVDRTPSIGEALVRFRILDPAFVVVP